MELCDWAVGVICCRRQAERLCEGLDGLIYLSAVNSAFESAESAAKKVADLMERKNKLINLKVLSDKLNELFTVREAEVIKLRYGRKLMFSEIAERTGTGRGTAALRLLSAVKKACGYLEGKRFNAEYFEREYAGEKFWLLRHGRRQEGWVASLRALVCESGEANTPAAIAATPLT